MLAIIAPMIEKLTYILLYVKITRNNGLTEESDQY